MSDEEARRVTLVERNLERELKHLGWRIEWKQYEVAKRVYRLFFQDLLGCTSPRIVRMKAEATEKMKQAGLLDP